MALTIYSKRPDIDSLPGRRRQSFPEITDELFWSLYDRAKPYSLLHIEGFFNLFQSIRYVVANRIPGCMIECGCFYGGASIFMALLARALGDQRPLIVFDTFAGMPAGQADAQLGGKVVVGPRYPSFLDAVQENFREAGACIFYAPRSFLLRNMDEPLGVFCFSQSHSTLGRFNDEFFPTSNGLFLPSVGA
jgi:hypothetical protein